jgi:hypothetical protein
MTTKNQPYGDQSNANRQLCTVLMLCSRRGKFTTHLSRTTQMDSCLNSSQVAQYTVDCNRRGMSLLKGADNPGSEDTHYIMISSGGVYNDNWLSRCSNESGR